MSCSTPAADLTLCLPGAQHASVACKHTHTQMHLLQWPLNHVAGCSLPLAYRQHSTAHFSLPCDAVCCRDPHRLRRGLHHPRRQHLRQRNNCGQQPPRHTRRRPCACRSWAGSEASRQWRQCYAMRRWAARAFPVWQPCGEGAGREVCEQHSAVRRRCLHR